MSKLLKCSDVEKNGHVSDLLRTYRNWKFAGIIWRWPGQR